MVRSGALRRAPRSGALPNRVADRVLRAAADGRVAVALLVAAAAWNAIAVVVPAGPLAIDAPPYALLLGAILLAGLAGVAVRLPAAWREWRLPGAVTPGRGAAVRLLDDVALDDPERMAQALRRIGYRVVAATRPGAMHGVAHGWTRLAGLAAHLALALLLLGVAVGAAYGTETRFSLLPGEQALVGDGGADGTDAVRLEGLDAAFGTDGRPTRLDTTVTFLHAGVASEPQILRVNEPGTVGDYLVHAWTYGPAASLRITTLADRVLHDGPIALDGTSNGRPSAKMDVPAVGRSVAIVLVDAAANTVAVAAGGDGTAADATLLRPGETVRVGDVRVRLDGFSSWVTFEARRDPGTALVFGGALLLAACLAAVLWLPRRRITLRQTPAGLQLLLRADRFDVPLVELDRVTRALRSA